MLVFLKWGKLAREGVNRGSFEAKSDVYVSFMGFAFHSGDDVKQAMQLVNLGFQGRSQL